MRYLIAGALLFLLACGGKSSVTDCPECPAPVPCPVCPDCPVIPPPPDPEPEPSPQDPCLIPISQRQRSDYIPLSQASTRQRELQNYDNDLWNNGWVNPGYALQHCGPDSARSVFPYGGLTAEATIKVMTTVRGTKERLTGADGKSGFYANLIKEHRNHAGRSRVFRPCFSAWVAQAQELLYGEGTPSDPKGSVAGLDGIKGACKASGG